MRAAGTVCRCVLSSDAAGCHAPRGTDQWTLCVPFAEPPGRQGGEIRLSNRQKGEKSPQEVSDASLFRFWQEQAPVVSEVNRYDG